VVALVVTGDTVPLSVSIAYWRIMAGDVTRIDRFDGRIGKRRIYWWRGLVTRACLRRSTAACNGASLLPGFQAAAGKFVPSSINERPAFSKPFLNIAYRAK
jgi:hypothetical protein